MTGGPIEWDNRPLWPIVPAGPTPSPEPAGPLEFTVYGTPRPQGSMKAFYRPGMRHAVVTSDNRKLRPWRQEITAVAMDLAASQGREVSAEPIEICLRFVLAKPRSARRRQHPTVKPDLDKLTRACLDALTGVLFRDDAQVIRVVAEKTYGEPERVDIRVIEVDGIHNFRRRDS